MDRKRKTKKINLLDLFSGIGGFSLGIQQAGLDIRWHGYSEIDKYANELFKRRFEDAEQLGSITDVSYKSLKGKRIDLLTGGFPCQAFSIAGRRRGFDDTRGTLFFEIARILNDYIENGKPIPCILLENVKGLLSHDSRRTFATIYKVLADLNYTLECQVVNTKFFGLPQNRERIFIFGRYNGNPSGRKIFPIGKNDIKANEKMMKLNQIGNIDTKGHNSIWGRVYDTNGIASTLNAKGGGVGAKTGLYRVHNLQPRTPNRPSLKTQSGGSGALSKKDGTTYCLEPHNLQAVEGVEPKIRRLTPVECERLQGFPDGWTEGQSNTQRYKQCGNAVSVPVIKAIMEKIYG